MAVILGIDTATTGCAVALIRDADCLAVAAERMARGQSEALAPMIEGVVRSAGIAMADINAIAVTRGPGAFTGLRIGLAAARAMALAISRPCLGIGTFDVLLLQAQEADALEGADALVVAIDSKREEQFIALFDPQAAPLGVPAALLPEEIPDRLGARRRIAVVGDGAESVTQALGAHFQVRHFPDIDLPDPRAVARLGLNLLTTPEIAPPSPLYLRPPDATPGKP